MSDRFDCAMRILGYAVFWVTAFILCFALIVQAAMAIQNPNVLYGAVTGKHYDDGHTWTDSFTIGRLTISYKNGDGKRHYSIEVTDRNGHTDWWEVPEAVYHEVRIGEEIRKSDVRRNTRESNVE